MVTIVFLITKKWHKMEDYYIATAAMVDILIIAALTGNL